MLPAFVWTDAVLTGIETVDAQHKELIDLFNELNSALFMRHECAEAVIESTYRRVIAYTDKHFAEEEALMLEEGVDPHHVEAHIGYHRQFVERVESMWSHRSALMQHPETIAGFLTSWLGLHILGVDQSMSRQIEAIRAGKSAAEAYAIELLSRDAATQVMIDMIGRLYSVLADQNTALANANLALEARVSERTAALNKANAELVAANIELERYSKTDALLQIGNRAYFDERLVELCARARRHASPLSLLMIDVDAFKQYNDLYGHQAGDDCLREVAKAIRLSLLRASDCVSRYGGEEIAVLLPDTDLAGAMFVAERMRDAVQSLGLAHAGSKAAAVVTVSIGVACAVPDAAAACAQLVRAADQALYRAKAAGRNRLDVALQAA